MVFPFIAVALSAASTAIMGTVSTIGASVASFAASVGPALATAVQAIQPIAQSVATFANSLLQTVGILQPGETIYTLGEKALQAAAKEITLETVADLDSYLADIRALEIDPELQAQRSPAEQLLSGLGLATVALERRFNVETGRFNGLWLLPLANPGYFTPERMQSLIGTADFGDKVLQYLDKELSGGDTMRFEKKLETPETPQKNLYAALDEARHIWAQLAQQLEQQ